MSTSPHGRKQRGPRGQRDQFPIAQTSRQPLKWDAESLPGLSRMPLFRYVSMDTSGGTESDVHKQLHFALQNASQWREVYDGFNYKSFYWFIVDYLEGRSTDIEELLDWWNE